MWGATSVAQTRDEISSHSWPRFLYFFKFDFGAGNWRQAEAWNFLFCRGGWGERSCPRSTTAIHSVAMNRTPNFLFGRRTFTTEPWPQSVPVAWLNCCTDLFIIVRSLMRRESNKQLKSENRRNNLAAPFYRFVYSQSVFLMSKSSFPISANILGP